MGSLHVELEMCRNCLSWNGGGVKFSWTGGMGGGVKFFWTGGMGGAVKLSWTGGMGGGVLAAVLVGHGVDTGQLEHVNYLYTSIKI